MRFHLALDAGRRQKPAQGLRPRADFARGLTQRHPVAEAVNDMARTYDLGRLPDHAAERPLRAYLPPQQPARIDALELAAIEAAAMLVEIPPGQAILAEQQRRPRPQQRWQRLDDVRQGVALEGEDDEVLGAELTRIGCHLGMDGHGLATLGESQTPRLHGLEMRAPRHQRHIRFAGFGEPRPDKAADRTGPKDANPGHARFLAKFCCLRQPDAIASMSKQRFSLFHRRGESLYQMHTSHTYLSCVMQRGLQDC